MSRLPSSAQFGSAVQDFWRARRRANLRELAQTLLRQDHPLMAFEDVRRRLRAVESHSRVLEEVPLDAIVGSVGRYNDFTREFLPRQDADEQRWAGVRLAMTGDMGVPPVELYRIGDAYFVKDGNHRVSVARQLGNRFIQAYVTPLATRVPFGPDTSPDELIIRAEEADFLDETGLDLLRPGADLSVTAPGQYELLLEHIRVHRYFMGLDESREISWEEAVTHWYDAVYLPVVEAIREYDLLRGFDGRTETDLYLWLGEHRGRLWRRLGFTVPTTTIASNMSRQPLSPAGRARLLASAATDGESLYDDILVGLTGQPSDAHLFRRALAAAAAERARLYVLTAEGAQVDVWQAEADDAGVDAQFVPYTGDPAEELLERTVLSDLVMVAADSSVRNLVRRCRKPLLLVSSRPEPLSHVLLAWDGGRRSEEAMFHAAWLVRRRGGRLTVLTVAANPAQGERTLRRARDWLSRQEIDAAYVTVTGGIADGILAAARTYGCDTIAMGSYKFSSWLENVIGGVPDEVIRRTDRNVLVI